MKATVYIDYDSRYYGYTVNDEHGNVLHSSGLQFITKEEAINNGMAWCDNHGYDNATLV